MQTNSSNNDYLFTSESVGAGHPDKVADQISDAVLDALLSYDPKSRVAAETLCTTGLVVMAGEITSEHPEVNNPEFYDSIARSVLRDIGYTDPAFGIDANTCQVLVKYDRQSPDIAQGVNSAADSKVDTGAGDQGIMFGFATDETPELMPMPILLAHNLMRRQHLLREDIFRDVLRPDAKAQVTLRYNEQGVPVAVDTIVLSTQHAEDISLGKLRELVTEDIIRPVLMQSGMEYSNVKLLINPTGRFVVGGPEGDCGLTGRKIIVDTYGGAAPHGGGAFSGKDATKVDRSAAYAARWVAKHIVAAGLARKAQIQLSYAIGVAEPVSIRVETFGTAQHGLTDNQIARAVQSTFSLTPDAIISNLELRQPVFKQTAAYGHFGRPEFAWEETLYTNVLLQHVGMN